VTRPSRLPRGPGRPSQARISSFARSREGESGRRVAVMGRRGYTSVRAARCVRSVRCSAVRRARQRVRDRDHTARCQRPPFQCRPDRDGRVRDIRDADLARRFALVVIADAPSMDDDDGCAPTGIHRWGRPRGGARSSGMLLEPDRRRLDIGADAPAWFAGPIVADPGVARGIGRDPGGLTGSGRDGRSCSVVSSRVQRHAERLNTNAHRTCQRSPDPACRPATSSRAPGRNLDRFLSRKRNACGADAGLFVVDG
jgi:hypothetical protein